MFFFLVFVIVELLRLVSHCTWFIITAIRLFSVVAPRLLLPAASRSRDGIFFFGLNELFAAICASSLQAIVS